MIKRKDIMKRKLLLASLFCFLISLVALVNLCSTVWGATQQVIIQGVDNALNASTTGYHSVMGGGNSTWDSDEANRQGLVPSSGTFDDLRVDIESDPDNGGGTQSFTFTVRLDGAGTTLGCAISDGVTTCNDSDSFAVTAGQMVSFEVVPANTPIVSNAHWTMTWNPTTADESILIGGGFGLSTSATNYLPIHATGQDTTQGEKKTLIPTAGTFDKLYVELVTAPGAGDSRTFTFGTVDCTITEAETTCNSGADTQAVTAGQTYELTATLTGTPDSSNVYYGIIFDPTTEGEFIIAGSSDSNFSASAIRFYTPSAGDQFGLATETDAYQLGQAGTFATAFTIEDIYVLLDSAPGAGNENVSWTLRVNGADASPALACTIADTATTCNSSASVSIANDDFLSIEMNPTVSTGSNPDVSHPFFSLTGFIPPSVEGRTRRIFTVTEAQEIYQTNNCKLALDPNGLCAGKGFNCCVPNTNCCELNIVDTGIFPHYQPSWDDTRLIWKSPLNQYAFIIKD